MLILHLSLREGQTYNAVSYTHLDVYKRQTLRSCIEILFFNLLIWCSEKVAYIKSNQAYSVTCET